VSGLQEFVRDKQKNLKLRKLPQNSVTLPRSKIWPKQRAFKTKKKIDPVSHRLKSFGSCNGLNPLRNLYTLAQSFGMSFSI